MHDQACHLHLPYQMLGGMAIGKAWRERIRSKEARGWGQTRCLLQSSARAAPARHALHLLPSLSLSQLAVSFSLRWLGRGDLPSSAAQLAFLSIYYLSSFVFFPFSPSFACFSR
jgi:hypothetical protein